MNRVARFYTVPRLPARLFASAGMGYVAPMRFAEADNSTGHLVEGYDSDGVLVGGRRYRTGLILTAEQILEPWGPADAAALAREHLEPVLALAPHLIVLGTGSRQVFPPPEIHVWVLEQRVGMEVMDTGAACRTYNILVSEGRRVAAALILD